ncbi:SDR family oxidoreductase [Paenibacillus sp. 1P07SE]|uniref:SDR family oxidoreductase n=1 Tax=Paenibacillus sp. 1P07SE TaxID=3132209 RepID=UPI0039A6DD44
MKTVLIAGASGYLGRYVVQEFKRQGFRVRVVVRRPEALQQEGPFLAPAIADLADEIFVGELTRPESLRGLCDGVDIVFSSVGITRQQEGFTYEDVDFGANMNLLYEAVRASVQRFLFISVFQAEQFRHLELVEARERFVEALTGSGLSYTIIRPTGFYSDLTELLHMGAKGVIMLPGKGDCRMNPIHGADLARFCVQSAEGGPPELSVGGPEVFTYRELAELAGTLVSRTPRLLRLPHWLIAAGLAILKRVNHPLHGAAAFLSAVTTTDLIAPAAGEKRLCPYFETYLSDQEKRRKRP